LTSGAVECTEVAGERSGCGNECAASRWILTNDCFLDAAEEEQLVAYDPATESATELVSLEAVLRGCEVIDRVDISVGTNSKAFPCHWFDPDLVTAFTTPPGCSPLRAGRTLVSTLNSASASGKGNGIFTLVKLSLLSPPSSS
jgi:hypothetical protein